MIENTNSSPNPVRLGARFQAWQGKSGRRYMHAVYPADLCPEIEGAVYLAVGRDASGSRRPLAIEGKAGFADSLGSATGRRAWPGGARIDEIHVHFVARTRDGLRRAVEDLSAEYGLP